MAPLQNASSMQCRTKERSAEPGADAGGVALQAAA